MPADPIDQTPARTPVAVRDALLATLRWSRERNYCGHEKHDGLNSPLLMRVCGGHRLTRLLAIQAVMRSPLDLRRLLRVRPHHNPKGLALFAQAWLDLADSDVARRAQHLSCANEVLEMLLEHRSGRGHLHGRAWGYWYPWQDPGFYAATGTPNAVVSAFACEALLDAHERLPDPRWLQAVDEAIDFFTCDLPRLKESADELCLGYMPMPMTMRVMDVSILIASVLARHARASGDPRQMPTARRLLTYVMRQQTDYHAWWYTDPPGDSHIRHDNYHTGFILDALWRWMAASGEREHEARYWQGLDYYRNHLFGAGGEPHWMNDQRYPFDIHGAAQGIITFARHPERYPGFAMRIADWALTHMYDPQGRFYYQQRRHYTKRFTFMRWCNAWMARALAVLLKESQHEAD